MTKAQTRQDPEPIDSPDAKDRAQDDAENQSPDDLAGDPVDSDVAMPKAPAAEALVKARRGEDDRG